MRSTSATHATRANGRAPASSPGSRPRNLLLYSSYSRGYKAGGFNLDRSALGQPIFSPTDPRQFGGRNPGFNTANLQFDPEIVNAWEAGFKWTQRSFVLNVAAFREIVQQLPAEHVQRLGLPGPEHQRLQHQPRHHRFGREQRHRRLRAGRRDFRRDLDGHRGRGGALSRARPAGHRRPHLCEHPLSRAIWSAAIPARRSTPALFLLPGDNLSNAPEIAGDGLDRLDAAHRRHEPQRARLCRYPHHRRL